MTLKIFLSFTCQNLYRNTVVNRGYLCKSAGNKEASHWFSTKFTNRFCSMASTEGRSTIRPLVVCGPSGVGKSTLLCRLMDKYNNHFGFSVSHTTRKPRESEVDGVHYHFTDKDSMQKAIANDEFIEYAEYSGNLYGTSKSSVYKVLNEGKICLLDIDTQGVRQIRETDLNPLMIFIKPPSIDQLKARLLARKTENEASIEKRIAVAKHEVEYGTTPFIFDLIITNDELEQAYEEFEKFIIKNYTL